MTLKTLETAMNDGQTVPEGEKHQLAKCTQCGVTSTLPELFRRTQINGQPGRLCPRCFEEWTVARSHWLILAMGIVAVIGWLLWLKGNAHLGLIMGGLACGFFFTVLLTPLHELAHALVALALRRRVYFIVIGWYGRPLFRFALGRCVIEVTRMPLGGMTYPFGLDTRFFRLKQCLITAAGPLLHIFLLLATWWFIERVENSQVQSGWITWLAMVFGAANAFEFVLNLWPKRLHHSTGEMLSDGLALVTIPFASDESIRNYPIYFHYYESSARLRLGDLSGAIECLNDGLKQFPGNKGLLYCRGAVLLDQGEYEEAARLFEELRSSKSASEFDANLLNNIAWADVLSERPERLERALDYSRKAMEAIPWRPEILGTRGSALVLAGEIDRGVALLRDAFIQNELPANRAWNAAFLALGSARQSRLEDARDWLLKSKHLDPDCPLLERVHREVHENAASGGRH